MTYYKFKNVKHSVVMKLLSQDENGNCVLENKDYKGLFHKAHISELEPINFMTTDEVFGQSELTLKKHKKVNK